MQGGFIFNKFSCFRRFVSITLVLLLCTLLVGTIDRPRTANASSISSVAGRVVLYDSALNNTPGSQGFLFLTNPISKAAARQTFGQGVTTLDSMPVKGEQAGYFAKGGYIPVLNRANGYNLSFTVQIEAEEHAGSDKNGDKIADRAGFSMILLGDDRRGIELGFWTNQIWAQEEGPLQPPTKLFTQAESAEFNTSVRLVNYNVLVLGDSYSISAGGKPILKGKLRDYSNFGLPYTSPNFIFLGDDTSSARAKVKLAAVSLVPDITTGLLCVLPVPLLELTRLLPQLRCTQN